MKAVLLICLLLSFVFCEEIEETKKKDKEEKDEYSNEDYSSEDEHSSTIEKRWCPNGYKRIPGACVLIKGPFRDQISARLECAINGGRLMKIEIREQIQALSKMRFNQHTGAAYNAGFIDGRRLGGGFFNMDGSMINKTLWARGQPTSGGMYGGSDEHCVEIRFGQRGLFETPCDKSFDSYVICQANTDFIPLSRYINCPVGYIQFGEKCLRLIRPVYGAFDARVKCNKVGGKLATVNSPEDLRAINDLTSFEPAPHAESAYVDGYLSPLRSYTYLNHDGTPIPIDLWCSGEPNNVGKQKCVDVWFDEQKLNSCPCSSKEPRFAACMADKKRPFHN